MSAFLRETIGSFKNAIFGISHLILAERHAKVHLICSGAVTGLGIAASISAVEWCLVFLAMGIVWATEAVNTAIERIVDLCRPEFDSVAGQAKDLAAGAVLLAALAAAAVGMIVFIPRIAAFL